MFKYLISFIVLCGAASHLQAKEIEGNEDIFKQLSHLYLGDAKKFIYPHDLSKELSYSANKSILERLLQNNPTLTELTPSTLNFSHSPNPNEGIRILSEVLKRNTVLTTLTLRDDKIGVKGIKYLSEVLKTNSTLTNLDLGGEQIGDEAAKILIEMLKMNTALQELHLSGYDLHSVWADDSRGKILGSEGAKILSEVLKTNSTLKFLSLQGKIGAEGAKYLTEMLEMNTSLDALNLAGNQIGCEGAKILSEALKTNSTLKSLYLSQNNISDMGVKSLSKALKANSTLKHLDLSHSQINYQGAKSLREMLQINTTLKSLSLYLSKLNESSGSIIIDGLQTNTSLLSLVLMYEQYNGEYVFINGTQLPDRPTEAGILAYELLCRNKDLADELEEKKAVAKISEASKQVMPLELATGITKTNPALFKLEVNTSSAKNNNNNNQSAENSVLATVFIEAHNYSTELTHEFIEKCLLPLYVSENVFKELKIGITSQLLIKTYQTMKQNNEGVKADTIEEFLLGQCGQSSMFKLLTQIYFRGSRALNETLAKQLIQVHQGLPEAVIGFTKEYLVPLYIEGKAPEEYKKELLYQEALSVHKKAVEAKDSNTIQVIEELFLRCCNRSPLFESLVNLNFKTL